MRVMKYRDLIDRAVAEVSARDANWNWSWRLADQDKFRLHWGYLDEIGQKDDFLIEFHDTCSERWFSGSMACDVIDDNPIVTIGDARWDDAKTIADAIPMIVNLVVRIAHARY